MGLMAGLYSITICPRVDYLLAALTQKWFNISHIYNIYNNNININNSNNDMYISCIGHSEIITRNDEF